jgi:hypothetical protein
MEDKKLITAPELKSRQCFEDLVGSAMSSSSKKTKYFELAALDALFLPADCPSFFKFTITCKLGSKFSKLLAIETVLSNELSSTRITSLGFISC